MHAVHLPAHENLGAAPGDVRRHYDRLAPLYRRFWGEHIHHGYWHGNESPEEAQENLTRELIKRARIEPDDHVLDIGCGFGASAVLMASENGCRVTGISISPAQVKRAKCMAVRRKLEDRVSFAVKDANELESDPELYDVIWIVECSEHIGDKPRFIDACARHLGPGGRLALAAWLVADDLSPAQQRLVEKVLVGMVCPSFGSMRDYCVWMQDAGLRITAAEDVTSRVSPTWDLCRESLHRPLARLAYFLGGAQTRAFANSFDAIAEAYRTGAMAYGMFVAEKPLLAAAK